MEYDYTPRGVCSRNIHVEVEDGIVKNVIFTGGLIKRITKMFSKIIKLKSNQHIKLKINTTFQKKNTLKQA